MKHFEDNESYIRDSLESVIEKISKFTIYSICFQHHQLDIVPFLVYEYVVLRFRFQAKWKKNEMDAAKKSSN